MPCYTTDTPLEVEQIDDGIGTIHYVVVGEESPLTITFTCEGTINSISVDPEPPRPVNNSITFTYNHLDQTFGVIVQYTEAGLLAADPRGGPLEIPTKTPTFKPVISCPS